MAKLGQIIKFKRKMRREARQTATTWEHKAKVAERAMRQRDYHLKLKGDVKVGHDFSHNQRVGTNAKNLVLLFGGTNVQANQAYIGGVTHDIERKDTNIPGVEGRHEFVGAKRMKAILERRAGKKGTDRIVAAVRKHSTFPDAKSGIVRQAVFIADTVEKLHSYSIFRRAAFQAVKKENIAEVKKYIEKKKAETKGWGSISKAAQKKLLLQWENEMALYFVKDRTRVMIREYADFKQFPERIRADLEKQVKLQQEFLQALDKKEKWAQHMALTLYWAGKAGKEVDAVVKKYKPILGTPEVKFKEEAVGFVDGKFFS